MLHFVVHLLLLVPAPEFAQTLLREAGAMIKALTKVSCTGDERVQWNLSAEVTVHLTATS